MYYKHKNMTIYYEKYGKNNNTIIILPGWGNTRNTFNYFINYFKDKYTIYIFDYPSFGKSPLPNKTLTIYDYANTIYDFLKKEKIIKPIIIAHSFGGRITSILLGKLNYKVNKIILIDVAGIKEKKNIKTIIKVITYKILKKLTIFIPKNKRNTIKDILFNTFSSSDYKEIPKIMRLTFQNIVKENLLKYYKNIDCETLIIWGEKDKDTSIKSAYIINKVIKDSGLIIIKDGNHFSYLKNPYTFNIIIEEYISKKELLM